MALRAARDVLQGEEDGGRLELTIRKVETKDDLGLFIDLPNRLYLAMKGYGCPLDLERRETLDPKKNAYFDHARACYWLAFDGDRPVGRISAQIDRLHLEHHGEKAGHFGLLDAVDDVAVFEALLETAAGWLRAEGMEVIRGPFNLSINEECGLLIDGFEHPPMLMMPYAPSYAAQHLEACGYAKARDLFAYTIDIDPNRTFRGARQMDRIRKKARVSVRPVNLRAYKKELGVILDIFNDAWADNWGFIPFTEAEMAQIARGMRPLVRAPLTLIAEVDNEPAAMLVCLPNLYEAIEGLNGRLLPFGWAKLLWRLKTMDFKTCRVALMGVRQTYHRTVLGSALILFLFHTLRENLLEGGYERVEMSWVLENNAPMRRLLEELGADDYKTYRLFEKRLA